MGRSALILAAAVAAAACKTSDIPPGRFSGGQVCQPGNNSCGSGSRCQNGICARTCSSSAACDPGQYCLGAAPDDVCAAVQPSGCQVDEQCPWPQLCIYGLCAAPELRADGGREQCISPADGGVDDGCARDAFCLGSLQGNVCLGAPACGQDGKCPPGSFGALCNNGTNPDGGQILPGKGRICLFGACITNNECPTRARCFRSQPGSVIGTCTYGLTGDPCFSNADCQGMTTPNCSFPDGGVADGGGADGGAADAGPAIGRCQ
jgi:hypothetical protein